MKRKLIEDLGGIIEGEPLEESARDGIEEESDEEVAEMAASESLKALRALLNEESESEKSIGALRDTDYRDKDAFFKMVQLLKGLATTVDEDETAKKFMSAVSDALTTAAKKVLGEGVEDLDEEVSKEAVREFASVLKKHPGVGVRKDYSGRGMYGDTCVGITVEPSLGKKLAKKLKHISYDSMGMNMILYWRGVQYKDLPPATKKVVDAAVASEWDDDDMDESLREEYKFPWKKKDLAPKTPANLKKRATLFKSATDKVDGALKDIAKIPPVDFMGDIPHFEKALKDILDGDGGEGGMRAMAKEYAREKGGK